MGNGSDLGQWEHFRRSGCARHASVGHSPTYQKPSFTSVPIFWGAVIGDTIGALP